MFINITTWLTMLASSQFLSGVLFFGIMSLCLGAITWAGGWVLMGLGITDRGTDELAPSWRSTWWGQM